MSTAAFGLASGALRLRLVQLGGGCGARAAARCPRRAAAGAGPAPGGAPARAVVVAREQLDSQGREYIRLDGFLKVQGLAGTGGQAKMLIKDGMVEVNGETEVRRGKKLRQGDRVQVRGDAGELLVDFD